MSTILRVTINICQRGAGEASVRGEEHAGRPPGDAGRGRQYIAPSRRHLESVYDGRGWSGVRQRSRSSPRVSPDAELDPERPLSLFPSRAYPVKIEAKADEHRRMHAFAALLSANRSISFTSSCDSMRFPLISLGVSIRLAVRPHLLLDLLLRMAVLRRSSSKSQLLANTRSLRCGPPRQDQSAQALCTGPLTAYAGNRGSTVRSAFSWQSVSDMPAVPCPRRCRRRTNPCMPIGLETSSFYPAAPPPTLSGDVAPVFGANLMP